MDKAVFKIRGLEKGFVFSMPTKDKVPKTPAQEIEVAKNRVYHNKDGLFVPSRIIKGAMLGAIRVAKMKIEKSVKRAEDLVKPLVFVYPEEIPIMMPDGKKKKRLTMDDIEIFEKFTPVDNGKALWLKMAKIQPGYELEFEIRYHNMLAIEFLREALLNAGLLCGIGGVRPAYGRFEVL